MGTKRGGQRLNLHLVTTRTQSERSVVRRLRGECISAYAPRYLDFGGTDGPVEHPLFPGYVFVWVHDQYRVVRAIPGVHDFVRWDGEPARVSQSIVDELRSRETGYGYVRLEPLFSIGSSVRLGIDGPVGLCVGLDSKARVRILLELLGRKVEMSLPAKDLVAA